MQTNKCPAAYAEMMNDKPENRFFELSRRRLEREIISKVSAGEKYDYIDLAYVIDYANSSYLGNLIDNDIDIIQMYADKKLDPIATVLIKNNLAEIAEDYVNDLEQEDIE